MSLPRTLSGVVLTGHAGPGRLAWRDDLPAPSPEPGEGPLCLAAGGNDIDTRTGWHAKSVEADTSGGAAVGRIVPTVPGAG